MGRAVRFLLKWAIILACVGFVAVGAFVVSSADPEYTAYELVYHARFSPLRSTHSRDAARMRNIDPMVVKAVVWRESRFQPEKVGLEGERGLMQITDAAAREWVKNEKIANFIPSDLFDPKVNIEIGTWLLARALRRYESKDRPAALRLGRIQRGTQPGGKVVYRQGEHRSVTSCWWCQQPGNCRRTSIFPARNATSRQCRTACSSTIGAADCSRYGKVVTARLLLGWV